MSKKRLEGIETLRTALKGYGFTLTLLDSTQGTKTPRYAVMLNGLTYLRNMTLKEAHMWVRGLYVGVRESKTLAKREGM